LTISRIEGFMVFPPRYESMGSALY